MRPRLFSACSKAAISAKRLSRWARPSRDRNDRLAPHRPSPPRGGWNQSVRSRTEGSGSMSFQTGVRSAKIDGDRSRRRTAVRETGKRLAMRRHHEDLQTALIKQTTRARARVTDPDILTSDVYP